jgi:hypothetical protein
MSWSTNDDPLPAYMFASWLSFLIPAAYISVHGPDILADGLLRFAYLLGWPLLADDTIVVLVRWVSAILFVFTNAVLFSGYLLFSFAPPAEGLRLGTYVWALATCAFCALLFPFSAWVWGGVWETRMGASSFTLLAWLLYVWRSEDSDRALRQPFVLFFRRFDSLADLSILPTLLSLSPRGVPVVMLVSGTENEVGYWDPLKLMTYGLRATVPWGGRPIFLRGGRNWESAMRSLVDRSAVVVLDRTEKSDALKKEIQTVTQAGRPLILLTEKSNPSYGDSIGDGGVGDIEIAYQRAKGALAVRAALLILILAITIYGVELPRQIQEKAAEGELWSGLFGAAIMLGFVSALFGGLLLRLGLTARVSRELSEIIRRHLTNVTRRD